MNADGSFSITDRSYHGNISLLVGMIDFPRNSEGLDKGRMVLLALRDGVRKNDVTKQSLIDTVNLEIKKQLSVKLETFHLLTSISLREPFPVKSVAINGARVRILGGEYPKKYTGRNEIRERYSHTIHKSPGDYSNVIVSVKAKSYKAAGSQAFNAIDTLRSQWCFYSNFSALWFYDGVFGPINRIC